jgi:phosphoserine phosphatase
MIQEYNVNKKLLVCDVEGTIFKPKRISIEHASYVWAALASKLGREAERAEDYTHKKWRNGEYGPKEKGESYMNWVAHSIRIHKKYGITETIFNEVIDSAEYYPGTEEFFDRLDRDIYIPILISGGIQQLSEKACKRLRIRPADSYVACSYFFNETGLDDELSFVNTSNFFGKQELVKLALRKYGLGERDWLFIGDGANDESIAKAAPLAIGIRPVSPLKEIVKENSFANFTQLLNCKELLEKEPLVTSGMHNSVLQTHDNQNAAKEQVLSQLKNFSIEQIEERMVERINKMQTLNSELIKNLRAKYNGILLLLEQGEYALQLFDNSRKYSRIVSAVLQPFCNANEIMIHLCYLLTAPEESIKDKYIFSNRYGAEYVNSHVSIKSIMPEMKEHNSNLSAVLEEYGYMRNICAHSYKLLSIEAAQTFARRTYENIQRMELMINPPGYSW